MFNFQKEYIEEFIPAPSEPLQFRAIGLVQGIYVPSEKEPHKGALITESNKPIDTVTLGKVISSLEKKESNQSHLFVVYPRTKEEGLHLQIMGVWNKPEVNLPTANADGYFSLRGILMYQSRPTVTDSDQCVVMQIRQAPKKNETRPKFFKLRLKGRLPEYGVNCFWDIVARLQDGQIVIQWGTKLTKYDSRKAKKKKFLPSKPAPFVSGEKIKKKIIELKK